MDTKKLSFMLYGGIAVCITIMLILFSGTLSDNEDNINSAPVTDELFVPESVVKLTEENTKLRTTMEQYADDIILLNEQITEKDLIIESYNQISKAAYLCEDENYVEAAAILEKIDITTLDENARILYEKIAKEIDY